MAIYEVTTEDGSVYEVETADQEEVKKPTIADTAKSAAKEILTTPINQFTQLNKDLAEDPSKVARNPVIQAGLPIAGGIVGGPAGAVGGEALRQMIGAGAAPETVPQTTLGRAASMATAGIAQQPKVLAAIPGVPQVAGLLKDLAVKTGKGAAKFGEALTGAKAQDLQQAARQGISTYAAPSMEKAQKIFGEALEQVPVHHPEGYVTRGISSKPPLEQIIDPQLETARKVALDVGKKLESGVDLDAGDALKARQAIDRIYNATPLIDRSTRGQLSELRSAFDGVISNKSGALSKASKIYRQAVVKSNLLSPFRITKQGQYSAVAPMLATLAAATGFGSGHQQESALGGLGYLAATSPVLAGGAATGIGTLGAIGANPAARQALLQVLQRLRESQKEKK